VNDDEKHFIVGRGIGFLKTYRMLGIENLIEFEVIGIILGSW
jgi:hypothetical protein